MPVRRIAATAAVVSLLAAVGALTGGAPLPATDGKLSSSRQPRHQLDRPAGLGDKRERVDDSPIRLSGAGSRAGGAARVARSFLGAWVDRRADPDRLRRQRKLLVGLATGEFARLVAVTIDDALATGQYEPQNQGAVVIAKRLGPTDVLVVTRERLSDGGEPLARWRFVAYVVRLAAVPGGYAVIAVEPQS